MLLPRTLAAVALSLSLASPIVSALTIGQIDTFQAGAAGWFFGGGPVGVPPTPPQLVPDGGPTGANDAYMLLSSNGGAGPGSRLSVLNASQWSGDYLSSGFATLEMDVRNFGTTDLSLRLVFETLGAMGPVNISISDAAAVSAGGGWTHIVFSLDPTVFTALGGTVAGALADTDVLRLVHAVNPELPPFPITALVGIDNISAGFVPRPGPFAVPEPSTLAMAAAAFALLGLRRRRAR